MDWIFVPPLPQIYVTAPAPSVAVSGDEASKEWITVKWGREGGTLSDRISALRGDTRELCLSPHTHRGKATWGHIKQTKKRTFVRNQTCQHLDHGLPDSRTARKYSVCHVNPADTDLLCSPNRQIHLFNHAYMYSSVTLSTFALLCKTDFLMLFN